MGRQSDDGSVLSLSVRSVAFRCGLGYERSQGTVPVSDSDDLDKMFEHQPLPSDPAERAALFASIDRGIADVRAGRTVAWEDVDRLTRQKLGLPPA